MLKFKHTFNIKYKQKRNSDESAATLTYFTDSPERPNELVARDMKGRHSHVMTGYSRKQVEQPVRA